MASDTQLTPMMAQYRRIKSELPKDALLLFRLGDFYEMFFEDAQAGGMDRQTLRDWVHRYNAEGLTGRCRTAPEPAANRA